MLIVVATVYRRGISMPMNKNKSTFKIALGGILAALTLVFMFGASFLPGIELTMYALSSIFVAIMILETNPKWGVMLYVVTSILGLLVVPNKLGVIPFVFFFGYYGIVKFYIEKIGNAVVQMTLKISLFLIVFGTGYFFFKELFFGNITLPSYPIWIIVILGVAVFVIYDFIYSGLINYYRTKVMLRR